MCLLGVCSVCAGGGVRAQTRKPARNDKQSVSVAWGATLPTGNGYIDKAGVANVSLEWNYRLFPIFSTGVSVGYTGLSDRGEADQSFDGTFYSGYRAKELDAVPIMARFDLFPLGDAETLFRPYMGAGVGVRYAKFRITGDAIPTSARDGWAEGFSARVGTRIYPAKRGRFFWDIRCTWDHGGNAWPKAKVKSIQNLGVMAGFGGTF